MTPIDLIEKYYSPGTISHSILTDHSRRVAEKALVLAQKIEEPVDLVFIEEAALLHDIGIIHTDAPALGCQGPLPYLAHGYMGRKMLEEAGLPRHALVCDRHIGVGISAIEIRQQKLPLPERDLIPLNIEEEIITYADLFFSKKPGRQAYERSADEVRRALIRFGEEKVAIFNAWHSRFSP